MEQAELEQIIEKFKLDRLNRIAEWRGLKWWDRIGTKPISTLYLRNKQIDHLPEEIGTLIDLQELHLCDNQLTSLPKSLGNLTNLSKLCLSNNQLTSLPENLGNLTRLWGLCLGNNQLTTLLESLVKLPDLVEIDLNDNQITTLSDRITNLTNLQELSIGGNQLTILPDSLANLTNLTLIELDDNPLTNLSILQKLPRLKTVGFLGTYLPRRYWTKLSEWKSEWLVYEDNTEIRRVLVQQLGYERICNELGAITIDIWREYMLLEISSVESIDREPMVLLKMTCPSTQHIHILRVPPEMVSAEAAITWVNHGIHPDEFAVQT